MVYSKWFSFGWTGPAWLAKLTGLQALPAHFGEIVLFAAFYFVLHGLCRVLFSRMASYRRLSSKVQYGIDVHAVSTVNAVVMSVLAVPLMRDPLLNRLDSYSPLGGMVVGHCVGYFVWDLFVTVFWYKYNGFGYLMHALTAFYVFLMGLRPFMLNVAGPFMLFEASTPFVNLNWLGSNVPNSVSPGLRTANGLVLLVVFFCCRIVSGPYNGFFFFKQVFTELPPNVPYIVVVGVLASYGVLVGLNFLWFWKMLKIAKKMATGRKKSS